MESVKEYTSSYQVAGVCGSRSCVMKGESQRINLLIRAGVRQDGKETNPSPRYPQLLLGGSKASHTMFVAPGYIT